MKTEHLRDQITEVKYHGFNKIFTGDLITFKLRGDFYLGELKGRNKDLLIGVDAEADKSIALRVLVDGHAKKYLGATLERGQS